MVGSEDGTVTKYSYSADSLSDWVTRCTEPIRELALSPDGNWLAVASEYVAKPLQYHANYLVKLSSKSSIP
jgi:chromosome transmission fidelity protein 4